MAQFQQIVLRCCFAAAAATSVILCFAAVSKINHSSNVGNEKRGGENMTKTLQDIPKYETHSEIFPWEPKLYSSEQPLSAPQDIKAFLSTMTFSSSSFLREPRCPCCK
jgi:hypothetical protein